MLRATFIERPNRFLVRCRTGRGVEVEAQLPNPGRLTELLLPGAMLHIERVASKPPPGSRKSPLASHRETRRRTRYTVWAVEREGEPVLLHTQYTNQVARYLLETRQIGSLASAWPVRTEIPVGRSRFDFLMKDREGEFLLEVKSVTLYGNGAALFPDAVTERGRHHLLRLAELGEQALQKGTPRPVVLFLVHSERVNRFLPDYHTDFAFSRTFLEVRNHVRFKPVSVGWTQSLELKPSVRELPIPWDFLRGEVQDRGAYLLLLRIGQPGRFNVGRLGDLDFAPGWYVYVGSARKGLTARVSRHLRKRKRFHWHIDFLRDQAVEVHVLAIRSSRNDECRLAAGIREVLRPHSPGFGSSDCSCPTHLFFSPEKPTHNRHFHDVLELFRMPVD